MIRIAICGIHIESSTFSPYLSDVADFEIRRGDALLARYPFLDADWASEVEWVPVFHARALPGGRIVASTYQAWKDEIVAGLAGERLDGVLFDIHGAMSVDGLTDAEGDLVTAIREVTSPNVVISAPMDLHGNVSEVLFNKVDMLTCYRTAPHVDVWETRERDARWLVRAIKDGAPARALVHFPFLLPGEKTSTRVEPARTLYDEVTTHASAEGVWDASFWIGFAWADEARCMATLVVNADTQDIANAHAFELATLIWSKVDEFEFVAPVASIDDCLEAAAASTVRPFVISDSGDNPGAGGVSDVTVAASAALQREHRWAAIDAQVLHAAILDPASVARADELGVGGVARFQLGARIDTREPGPIDADFEVVSLGDDPTGGRCALLRAGHVHIIVTSQRNQYDTLIKYSRLGIDPAAFDIVIVKIGYLEPQLYEMAADWLMALTPGAVDQDLVRLGHHKIVRPMIPFDDEVPFVLDVMHPTRSKE